MPKKRIICAVLLVSIPAAAAHADGLATAIAKRVADARLRGAAIGIVEGGQIAPPVLAGDAQAPTAQFEIGSITKSFTALVAAELAIQGKLDLDAPISKLLPELAGTYAGTITPEQLGTHTARLPRGYEGPLTAGSYDDAALIAWLKGYVPDPQLFPPGVRQYSNVGFAALGLVAARAAGGSATRASGATAARGGAAGAAEYTDLVQSLVLDPLKMSATGFLTQAAPPEGLLAGYDVLLEPLAFSPAGGPGAAAGGLHSNASDMTLYVQFELAPESFGELGQAALLARKRGLGWDSLPGVTPYWKNGAMTDGFSSMLKIDPAKKTGAIVLINALNLPEVGALADVALGADDAIPDPTFPAASVTALAGTYVAAGATITIKAIGTQYLGLAIDRAGAQSVARAFPVAGFAYLNDGVTFMDRLELAPESPTSLSPTVTSFVYDSYQGDDSTGNPRYTTLTFQRQK